MKAFARLKEEDWCMDVAYVGKLAKNKKGVKNLPFRKHLFKRTVDANGKKGKIPKKLLSSFNYNYKKKT